MTVEVVGSLGGRVASAVATDGYLYVGEGRRIVVYGVEPGGAMTPLGQSSALPDVPSGLVVHGAYLYAATAGGVLTLDIADPARPHWVNTIDARSPGSIALSGATLAVGLTGSQHGVRLFDVSEPAQPRVLGTVLPTGWDSVTDVLVDGALLVASGCCSSTGLQLFDISDPAGPVALGAGRSSSGPLARHGDVVYVGGGSALELWDIADRSGPSLLSSIPVEGGVNQLLREGDLLVAQGGIMGLRSFDISDARQPVQLARLSGSGLPVGLTRNGALLFAAYRTFGRPGGVSAIDITEPRNPRVVDELVLAGSPVATVADGPSLVVLTSDRGPGTHGISLASDTRCDGLEEQRVHWFRSPGFRPIRSVVAPAATWVLGLLGAGGGDLGAGSPVLQALSPDINTELGAIEVGGYNKLPKDLAHFGNTLYVAGEAGLMVVDGSDPRTPSIVAQQPGDYSAVAVAGDVLATLTGTQLLVGRIGGPLALPELAPVIGAGAVDALALDGTSLYTRSGNMLRRYSVVDPAAPRLVATGDAGEGSTSLAADDGVLVGWGNSGRVNVIAESGDMLRQVGTINGAFGTVHVTVDQGRVFVAAGEWGLLEARVSGVGTPSADPPRGAHRAWLPLVSAGCGMGW